MLTEFNMTDHEFAAWLRRNKWDSTRLSRRSAVNVFYDDMGQVIASVEYNNAESTRRIFLQGNLSS